MEKEKNKSNEFPGLYQAADNISGIEQRKHFNGIRIYTVILIIASIFSFYSDSDQTANYKMVSAVLFLFALGVLIWQRHEKPESIWYNGRAVAEYVKTRTWKFMMRTDPYSDSENLEIVKKEFIQDLKSILKQNTILFSKLGPSKFETTPISTKMLDVRSLDFSERLEYYKQNRIQNQATWYATKASQNKRKSQFWFWCTVFLHALAIILLLYNIKEPLLKLPIEIIATAASGILSWIQAKKYNEHAASYSLTSHEIMLLKAEDINITNEEEFSGYVLNCENAFSREHTQWGARKNE